MIKKLLFLFALCTVPMLVLAADAQRPVDEPLYAEGMDYHLIVPSLPSVDNGKVEVVEMFWYGCPHCFRFDPDVNKWLQGAPDYIEFKRMPAIFNNPTWQLHATAFYTAEALGVLEKLHQPLFDAINVHKRPLNSEELLQQFFLEQGVSEADFSKTFSSFAVKTRVNRAADISGKSGLTGVPVILVACKYRIDGPTAGSYERLLKIFTFLADKEHKGGS
ncbi:MAG: thiol:disulfide interchange protein DsbA/DsbL [Gammaproteobacteria bacterium]|nr:thiol:disulfide interchange protein DsbA/DsbL [Gammaproteobacteria bacterium]